MASKRTFANYGSCPMVVAVFSGLLLAGWDTLQAKSRQENAPATVAAVAPAAEIYSPPLRFATEDTNLYWGDTHVHTSNSADAFGMGNTTVGPEDAFHFAAGQEITATNGMRVKLRRPLDFVAVADHAEYLGAFPRLARGTPTLNWERGRRWGALLKSGDVNTPFREFLDSLRTSHSDVPPEFAQSVWRDVATTADRFNNPGRFTAFIGYEWTSTISGDHLHRNVIFRDGAGKVTQITPFSALDSRDPEKLWEFLRRYEAETGGQVLAIPHNGNYSNGRMFAPQSFGDDIPCKHGQDEA